MLSSLSGSSRIEHYGEITSSLGHFTMHHNSGNIGLVTQFERKRFISLTNPFPEPFTYIVLYQLLKMAL
jgi:hypothetical protein